jgi:hypothetical protein
MMFISKERCWCQNVGKGKNEWHRQEGFLVKHWEKIPKATWASFNFKSAFKWQTSVFNTSCKKEVDLNGTPKTLIPSVGQQKLDKGEKLGGKLKGDQVKQLQH